MAGSQDPDDNPVAINVVPMVDVIFCLCVFFMCSFKFKELEGKFDSWLPKNKGAGAGAPVLIEEIRIALFWDDKTETVTRQFGTRKLKDDDDLSRTIKDAHQDHVKVGKGDDPVTIDGDPRVPWDSVISVVNIIKRLGIERIEFAFGSGPPTIKK